MRGRNRGRMDGGGRREESTEGASTVNSSLMIIFYIIVSVSISLSFCMCVCVCARAIFSWKIAIKPARTLKWDIKAIQSYTPVMKIMYRCTFIWPPLKVIIHMYPLHLWFPAFFLSDSPPQLCQMNSSTPSLTPAAMFQNVFIWIDFKLDAS